MSTLEQFKVLIVDDSSVVRDLLEQVLHLDPRLEVVGKAVDGVQGLRMLLTTDPDLVLLDIEMPNVNGLEFIKSVRGKSRVKIIVVSAYVGPSHLITAKQMELLGVEATVAP